MSTGVLQYRIEKLEKENATWTATVAQGNKRILELELEVKRLREGLQKSKIEYWACFVNTDPKMTVHEFDDSIDKVLSAPPPALTESEDLKDG